MKHSLRIRTEPNGLSTVWLIGHDGAAMSGLLYGVMPAAKADALEAVLGLSTERVPGYERADEPRPDTEMARQGELFKGT